MNPLLVAALLLAAALPPASAALRARLVAEGFANPLFATAPADDPRLFVVEQGGLIRILNPATGKVRGTPFLTVTGILVGGERGLLGLAFHPDYARNGTFFVNVTRSPDGATEIRRYRVSADPNVAATNFDVLLTIPQPFDNHNGGWLGFGPDGFLHVASGDGGSGNDPGNRAQNPNSLLGKILRLDVDRPGGGRAYGIPQGNPFAAGGGAPEVFHSGLRNPWRCSFDRVTGDFWIGDVGQSAREEINFVSALSSVPANFGWRVFEGGIRTPGIDDPAPANATPPLHDYPHSLGRSVTAGYAIRSPDLRAFAGRFVFGDFLSGRVWTLLRTAPGTPPVVTEHTASLLDGSGIPLLSSFAEDAAGRIYALSFAGTIHRLVADSSGAVTVRVRGPLRRTVTAARTRIQGIARSAEPIVSVRYRIQRSIRFARGREQWNFPLRVRPGVNRMVIQAEDAAGNRSSPVVVIVRRPLPAR